MRDETLLSIRALRHDVDGRRVLDIGHLDLPKHGISVILGPNGAGKSVLLRLMHGILPVQEGRIAYSRQNPRQAMVFQRPVLLRRSVHANITFALRASGQDPSLANTLLDRAGLAKHAHQPARSLSGGEQQRLSMARALATQPDVLFLDEPTANLDPAATLALEEMALQTSKLGTKIIMVTHNLAQARRMASDLSILHEGLVLESGPAREIFDNPATQKAAEFLSHL